MQTDPGTMPQVNDPPMATGTRTVVISSPDQIVDDWSTLRDLTLSPGAADITVPPGSYGEFSANVPQKGFILGQQGGTQPQTYSFEHLALSAGAVLKVVGPVTITVRDDVVLSDASIAGDSTHPSWLRLDIARVGLTLNSGSKLIGLVRAPKGTVTVSGTLEGAVIANSVVVNGGGKLTYRANQAPAVQITQPTTGTRVAVNTNLPVQVATNDTDGVIKKLEIWGDYGDGPELVESYDYPTNPQNMGYSFTELGQCTISAKVTDDRGATIQSDPVTVLIRPQNDLNLDGLSDDWEQQIVDADPNDNIRSIDDVRPEDDFDHDGVSNAVEYTRGTSPISKDETPILIGWWKMDETIGTAAMDSGTNHLNGSVIGTVGRLPGVDGNALDFGGRQTVRIAANSKLNFSGPFSISAWVRPRSFDTETNQEIYRKEDGNNRVLFSFQSSGTVLSFGINTNGTYQELHATISPADYLDGRWHLVTAVYDGTSKKLYRDGQLLSQQAVSGALVTTGTADAYLGSYGNTKEYFNGALDDVRIYRLALTSGELQQRVKDMDSDGNGLPDSWEREHFGQIGVAPDADTDGDGLTNADEFKLGTDPLIGNSQDIIHMGLRAWLRADTGVETGTNGDVTVWRDQSGQGQDYTQPAVGNRPRYNSRRFVEFDGVDDYLNPPSLNLIKNNFTVVVVADTSVTHQVDAEKTTGTDGMTGQRFLIYPNKGDSTWTGAGFSLGSNGFSSYEQQGDIYMPARAVYSGAIGNFFNVLGLQYNNRLPRLYLNGQMVRQGSVSPKSEIRMGWTLGGGNVYGYHKGEVAEVLVYDRPLSDVEWKALNIALGQRWQLLPTGDPDGDLWTNAQEAVLGSNPVVDEGNGPLWLEAEDADQIDGWTIADDPLASGGHYLFTSGFGTNENREIMATWRFTVKDAGDYIVMGRVIAPSQDADTLWIRMDSVPWTYRKLPSTSAWKWHTLNAYPSTNQVQVFTLSPGVHTLTLRVRQFGTQLDKLAIMKNVPSLQGQFTVLNPEDSLDSDRDGMPDNWERAHGLDPNNAQDADADADHDGRSNRLEYAYGSNPQVADVTVPATLASLSTTEITDVAATIQWSGTTTVASVFSRQDLQYDIYRNGTKIGTSLVPNYRDTSLSPATAYSYTVVARDREGNTSSPSDPLNVTTLLAQLPTPWKHGEVTPQDVRGSASYDTLTGKFALHVVSTDAYVNPDVEHWVYQALSGNVRITARLDSLSGQDVRSQAGITLRASEDGNAAMARLGVRTGMGALWESRFSGALKDSTFLPVQPVPTWLRLERRGTEVKAFFSNDGSQWQPVGTRWVELGNDLLFGLYAAGREGQPVDAVFSQVTIDRDSDGDGLFDSEEMALGTNPNDADTDKDGISDYREVYELGTNPLHADVASLTTITTIAGSAFTVVSGQWMTGADDSVVSLDRRGAVDYTLNIPANGIWFLELDVSALGNTAGLHVEMPLQLYLDGELLGDFTMQSFSGSTDTIHAQTPWIPAGIHTLRVVNKNPFGNRTLDIHTLRLLRPDGEDNNGDGIPDWVTQKLASENTVKTVPGESLTSPFCVEGTARNPDRGEIVVAEQSYQLQKQANGLWYADIPLNEDSTTAIETRFEDGAAVSSVNVTWKALNVIETNGQTLRIRKGDSLRLTAYPVTGEASGDVQLNIISTSGTNTASTTADDPIVATFGQAGTYTIQATSQQAGASGSVTVQVVGADFGTALVAYLQNARNWSITGVQPDAPLQWDNNLVVSESTPPASGGRLVQVYPIASGAYYTVARLSTDGPVLARGEVDVYAAYSATTTGDTHVVTTYDDGDRLVQSTIVVDGLPPGGYAEVRIIVAGVTFDDGTTVKRLYASDFVNGVATLTFNYPKDVAASVCHQVFIYDAQGNQVGALQ